MPRDEEYFKAWHAQAVKNDIARIERAARTSSVFLIDAPDGSSALREAMLVAAIDAIRLQRGGCTDARMTTGLTVAIAAAVEIAGRKSK